MRLLTRRIYRAFPELDRYGDEQCLRFVKAARGSWLRRQARSLVVVLVGVAVLFGVGFVGAIISDRLGSRYDPFNGGPLMILVACAVMAVAVAPAPIAAFLARDFLLRRRVRFILRSRGVCSGCWYSLVGLPVGPGNTVNCPECGVTTEVDPSLGELVTDQAGQQRFQPEVGHVDFGQRFWTPRRKRTFRRTLLWSTASVAVLLIIGAGGHEWLIRRQARVARAAMVGVEGLGKHILAHQPVGADASGGTNAFDVLERIMAIRSDADTREWREKKASTAAGNPIEPDFGLIYAKPDSKAKPYKDDPERDPACEALACRMLGVYRADGLESALAELASAPRAVRKMSLGEGEALFGVLAPDLGEFRWVARISAARMAVAREAGDRDAFVAALEQGLAAGRIVRHQPLLIDALVACAIDDLMFTQLAIAIGRPVPGEWLDEIGAAVERQRAEVPFTFHLEGERIMGTDSIAWVFSDPNRVRLGRFSPELLSQFGVSGSPLGQRLGTYSENIAAYSGVIEDAKKAAAVDPVNRPASAAVAPSSSLMLINLLMPALGRSLYSADQAELRRRGVTTYLAIERFRVARGRPPTALSELVPAFLDKVPLDPYSGKPFAYKLLTAPEEHGRVYLLYSVGLDRVDDGGVSGEESRKRSGNLTVGPMDVIINEADQPAEMR